MIFKVYRLEILKISSKNFQEKNSKFKIQKFETFSSQFEPVWASLFQQFWMFHEQSFYLIHIHSCTIILNRFIGVKTLDGNTKMFSKYDLYILVVLKLFEFEPGLPNNKHDSWLESACIFQNTKTDFFDNHTLIGFDANFHALN